jgi:hypothetical protein
MDEVADVEALVIQRLRDRLDAKRPVTRKGRDDLAPGGVEPGIEASVWDDAVTALIGDGKILVYKINDLPNTLPDHLQPDRLRHPAASS